MRSVFPIIAAVGIYLAVAISPALAQQLLELNTWYSASRGDHITTTDPAYARSQGPSKSPDYKWIRSDGWVFSPDEAQPADTVALWNFWNPERGDNFLTTDPSWTGTTQQQGYTRFRLEGYIQQSRQAGTLPLRSFWSDRRKDNAASTDPRLTPRADFSVPEDALASFKGGDYRHYRVQGYVFQNANALARQPEGRGTTVRTHSGEIVARPEAESGTQAAEDRQGPTAIRTPGGTVDGQGCLRNPLQVQANGLYRGRTENRAVTAWENNARRDYGADYAHISNAERSTSHASCTWSGGLWRCTLRARACMSSSTAQRIGQIVFETAE